MKFSRNLDGIVTKICKGLTVAVNKLSERKDAPINERVLAICHCYVATPDVSLSRHADPWTIDLSTIL